MVPSAPCPRSTLARLHGITDEFVARLARARRGGRTAAPAARGDGERVQARRTCSGCCSRPGSAVSRRRFPNCWNRFGGWRTAARRARGRWASMPCTTGCCRCSTPQAQEEVFASGPVLAPGSPGPDRPRAPRPAAVCALTGQVVVGDRRDGRRLGDRRGADRAAGRRIVSGARGGARRRRSRSTMCGTPRACGAPAPTTSSSPTSSSRSTASSAVADIYAGTAPGARVHDGAPTYRWPMVPALALVGVDAGARRRRAGDRALRRAARRAGSWRIAVWRRRISPPRRSGLGDARVRLRALRALIAETADGIDQTRRPAASGCSRSVRADARLAAAHTVHECRAIIADLLEASGASAQFLSNPLQRAQARRGHRGRARGLRLRHEPRVGRGVGDWRQDLPDRDGLIATSGRPA